MPTNAQACLWYSQLNEHAKTTIPDLSSKLYDLYFLGAPLDLGVYKFLTKKLSNLAERCLYLNLYMAQVMRTRVKDTKTNRYFIDYVKAAGRNMDMAMNLTDDIESEIREVYGWR
jgi:hypothetical protein